MSDAFVSITKHEGEAVIEVDFNNRQQGSSFFPLTKRGCIEAGKWLHRLGVGSWLNSSSVDSPREVKKSFRHNVSDLMDEGYRQLVLPEVVKAERVGEYEIRGNQHIAIAINVNDPKDAHYFTIDPEVNNDAFIRACGWAYPGI